jgi:hypothetical protein
MKYLKNVFFWVNTTTHCEITQKNGVLLSRSGLMHNALTITCCQNTSEDPTLAILYRFLVLVVLLKNLHAAHPLCWGGASIKILPPVAHKNTIIIT